MAQCSRYIYEIDMNEPRHAVGIKGRNRNIEPLYINFSNSNAFQQENFHKSKRGQVFFKLLTNIKFLTNGFFIITRFNASLEKISFELRIPKSSRI